MKQRLFFILPLIATWLGGAFTAQAQTTYSYSGPNTTSGNTYSNTSNWTLTGGTADALNYPASSADTANITSTTANTTVLYDTAASGALGNLSLNAAAATTSELEVSRNLAISSALTLSSSTGTVELLIATLGSAGVTVNDTANLTIGNNGVLELFARNPGTTYNATFNNNVLLQTGGTILSDLSDSQAQNHIGGSLTMTGGTIALGHTNGVGGTNIPAERLYIAGNFQMTGGSITASSSGSTIYMQGSSNYIGGTSTSIASAALFELNGTSNSTFYSNTAIGALIIRNGSTNNFIIASGDSSGNINTSGTLNLTQLQFNNSGTNKVQLGSNVTTTTTSASGGVIVNTGGTTGTNTLDLNGYTLDTTASSGAFAPTTGSVGSATVGLINSSTTVGTLVAASFNLSPGTGGVSVGTTGNTVNLKATGVGASEAAPTANNLSNGTGATGTIAASSNFVYAGASAGGFGFTTLASTNRTIGGVQVQSGYLTAISPTATPIVAAGNVALTGGTFAVVGATPTSSGTLANTAAGTFNITSGANFTMGSGATLSLVLVGTTTSSNFNVSSGTSSFTITGGTLSLAEASGFTGYLTTYNLFNGFTGTNSVSGLTITGYDTVDYLASLSTSGVLSFTATPEPGTWLLLLLGLPMLALAWRRRLDSAQRG